MIHIFKKILKTGTATEKNPLVLAPKKARGKIIVDAEKCTYCQQCVLICPVQAISYKEEDKILSFNYAHCMYCGLCVEQCPNYALSHSNQLKKSVHNLKDLVESFHLNKKAW